MATLSSTSTPRHLSMRLSSKRLLELIPRTASFGAVIEKTSDASALDFYARKSPSSNFTAECPPVNVSPCDYSFKTVIDQRSLSGIPGLEAKAEILAEHMRSSFSRLLQTQFMSIREKSEERRSGDIRSAWSDFERRAQSMTETGQSSMEKSPWLTTYPGVGYAIS